ncbi:hypothetical protein DKX38_005544 [Salix brachista]|uniref:RING-type domain-containing protein n=1 Tax=Salix brachista TaxID=2182728 RepID=A0A5N5N036_9ROSI|nr:hypothetical protein DKX38_005544 [Salix brachista]
MYIGSVRNSFKDSLKVLEADIQHANTLLKISSVNSCLMWTYRPKWSGKTKFLCFHFKFLFCNARCRASDISRDYDGACLQMRMSYSPAANLFLFLVQWTDCHLAGALGLLRILIYKVYVDGTTTMTTHERKASIREFYAVIYPSLLQLQRGVTDTEDKKQKAVCMERYRRRDDEEHRQHADVDIEREEECGICMEMNSKIVLPNCNHAMCLKCYRECSQLGFDFKGNAIIIAVHCTGRMLYQQPERFPQHIIKMECEVLDLLQAENTRSRSQSCPFCRDSLKRVNSGDLWVFTDSKDIVDMATVTSDNLRRLFMYVDKLPLIIPDNLFDTYDSHVR